MTWGALGSRVVLVVVETVVVVEAVVVVEGNVVTGGVELVVEVDDDVGGPVVVVAESLQATVSTMTANEADQRHRTRQPTAVTP